MSSFARQILVNNDKNNNNNNGKPQITFTPKNNSSRNRSTTSATTGNTSSNETTSPTDSNSNNSSSSSSSGDQVSQELIEATISHLPQLDSQPSSSAFNLIDDSFLLTSSSSSTDPSTSTTTTTTTTTTASDSNDDDDMNFEDLMNDSNTNNNSNKRKRTSENDDADDNDNDTGDGQTTQSEDQVLLAEGRVMLLGSMNSLLSAATEGAIHGEQLSSLFTPQTQQQVETIHTRRLKRSRRSQHPEQQQQEEEEHQDYVDTVNSNEQSGVRRKSKRQAAINALLNRSSSRQDDDDEADELNRGDDDEDDEFMLDAELDQYIKKPSKKKSKTSKKKSGANKRTQEEDNEEEGNEQEEEEEGQQQTARTRKPRREVPVVKVTLSDFMHDTKSGRATRSARKKEKHMDRLKKQKKREQMKQRGIPVEASSESDGADSGLEDDSQRYTYDIYGSSSSGLHGAHGDAMGDEGEYYPYGSGNGGMYDEYGTESIVNGGGGGGDGEYLDEQTYDNFDMPSASTGADHRVSGMDDADEKDQELTDMYLEEDEEDNNAAGGEYDEDAGVDATPQLQIDENGQVILNQMSVTVTRSGPKGVNYDEYERVTETFGSRHITQATFSRYRDQKTKKWTDDDTRRLFDAVQQFGTDFSMIVRLFPTRSRREVRNKFKKEERAKNPSLTHALKNKKPINIEMFKKLSAERDKVQGVVRKTRAQILAEQQEQAEAAQAVENANRVVIEHHDATANDADEWEAGGLETGTTGGIDDYESVGLATGFDEYYADDAYEEGGYAEDDMASASAANRVVYENNDDLTAPSNW